MKLFTVALLATTATALALPRSSDQSPSCGQMSVKQGQDKCGSQAKLSCCNNQVHSGDAYNKNKGLLEHGILSDLLNGHSQNGLGVFEQCSEITSDSMLSSLLSLFFFFFVFSFFPVALDEVNVCANESALVNLNGLLSDRCKQNVACCDSSNAKTV